MGKGSKQRGDVLKVPVLTDSKETDKSRKYTEPAPTAWNTNFTIPDKKPESGKLTDSNDTRFIISFRYKLKKAYTFTDLQWKNVKEFQRFLDKVSNMTLDQVEKLYHRDDDPNDLFNGEQITHYKVTDSFRIHGVFENGLFVVLRLDLNHRVHSK